MMNDKKKFKKYATVGILILISFLAGYFMHSQTSEVEVSVLDLDLDLGTESVSVPNQKLEISSRVLLQVSAAVRECEAAYFSDELTNGTERAKECAQLSIDYSEWATTLVYSNELLPVKNDILSIRDNLTKLSYIGQHLIEPKNDERDTLPIAIQDSVTNIRQHLSEL